MISVTRKEPGAFVPADVQLLRTFADQAVIAVNNVGLFNETQEALEQQKAASEVLQVISRSTFDLDLVFQTLVENAVRLCGAEDRHDLSPGQGIHAGGRGRRGDAGIRGLCAEPTPLRRAAERSQGAPRWKGAPSTF